MSGINMSFNAATVAPNATPEPVPTGIYDVIIVASEEKPVNGKPGQTYYQFDMQITDGPEKGKKVVDRLNCKNPNPQTVDIAYGTLSAICHVTGIMQIGQSSAELHNRPFKVNVVKGPRSDDPTKDGNEIRGYLDAAGNPPGKSGGAAAANNANAAAFGATTTTTAAAPPPPGAPAAPPAPGATIATDPIVTAEADGWIKHPTSPTYHYKGTEVKLSTEVAAMYAVPNPTAPGATSSAPASPEAPATGGASADAAIPSWAQ